MQESDADEDQETDVPKSGSWKPQLHFVWDVLLDQLLSKDGSARASKGTFLEFFRIVVDGMWPPSAATALSLPVRLTLIVLFRRISVRFDVFARAEILGLPGVSEGAAPRYRR